MSRGDWRSIAALGLAVALYLTWLAAAVVETMPALEYDPAQYQTEAERREGREDQDTYAQIWMGWVGVAQLFIGAVGLLGLAATVVFARNAWLEAQQANADARDFFVAERRAWLDVAVNVQSDGFAMVGDEVRLKVEVTARNVGLSPALHVFFAVRRQGLMPFADEQREILKAEIADHKAKSMGYEMGDTIFPNGKQTRTQTVQIKLGGPEHSRSGNFYVPAYASYQFGGSERRHVTPVVQMVFCHVYTKDGGQKCHVTQAASFMGLPPD